MDCPSPKELEAEHRLLLTDPQSYVALKSEAISRNPHDSQAYFNRHLGWLRFRDLDKALADISTSIALKAKPIALLCRGQIFCRLGHYQDAQDALKDFDRAEELDPVGWPDLWGPLHQADCHSRLGNELKALTASDRLKDDHWTPGLDGAPAGNKQDVIAEVRRRLAALGHT